MNTNTEIITEFDPELILEIISSYCDNHKEEDEAEFERNEELYKAKISMPHKGLKMRAEVLKMKDEMFCV